MPINTIQNTSLWRLNRFRALLRQLDRNGSMIEREIRESPKL